MNTFKKAVFAATVAVAGFSASSAHAALINGDQITLTSGSYSSTVAIKNGVEFSNIANYLAFDFSANQLVVSISQNLPSKFVFGSDLSSIVFTGFDSEISGFSLTSNAPQFKNFDNTDYSFTKNSITLNFAGVDPSNNNAEMIFSIATQSAGPVPGNSVPEPTTVALLGLGLGLLGFAASRRDVAKK